MTQIVLHVIKTPMDVLAARTDTYSTRWRRFARIAVQCRTAQLVLRIIEYARPVRRDISSHFLNVYSSQIAVQSATALLALTCNVSRATLGMISTILLVCVKRNAELLLAKHAISLIRKSAMYALPTINSTQRASVSPYENKYYLLYKIKKTSNISLTSFLNCLINFYVHILVSFSLFFSFILSIFSLIYMRWRRSIYNFVPFMG